MYRTCGQWCVIHIWVVGFNILIGHIGYVVSLCFDIWVLGSKIAIVLYVLDMWSVLCVPYMGGGI